MNKFNSFILIPLRWTLFYEASICLQKKSWWVLFVITVKLIKGFLVLQNKTKIYGQTNAWWIFTLHIFVHYFYFTSFVCEKISVNSPRKMIPMWYPSFEPLYVQKSYLIGKLDGACISRQVYICFCIEVITYCSKTAILWSALLCTQ